MNFKFVRNKIEKTRADVKKNASEALRVGQFKKIEFRDKGMDTRSVLNKLGEL